MDVRSLLLVTVLSLAALSGCISAKDDVDPSPRDDTDTDIAAPQPVAVGIEELDMHAWSGPGTLDRSFPVPRDFDHLVVSFTHTGQVMGDLAFTSGEGPADQGTFATASGAMSLLRTLPGTEGTATLRLDGALSGAGTFAAFGVEGMPPQLLFDAIWSGQRNDLAGPMSSEIGFYVPEGVERVAVTLQGTGQKLFTMQIVDADGEVVTQVDSGVSTQSSMVERDAVPGMWKLVLQGSLNGAWSANVVSLDVPVDVMVEAFEG